MAATEDIPLGVFAFDSDGAPLGEVIEVSHSSVVTRDESGKRRSYPARAVVEITAGKLIIAPENSR